MRSRLAIELHWFWMALGSLCIIVLAAVQFFHALSIQRRDDELRAIIDAAPQSLFFKDTALRYRVVTRLRKGAMPTGRELVDTVILTDPKIREICGLGAEAEISYHALYRMLHPADRARVAATLGLAYRQGTGAYRDQFRVRARDGVTRTVDVRGSLTKQAGLRRDEILFTGIAKDITREEALKADLITKAEEARSALDAKRQFLAMMSHEVRTPLTGILGMIDLTLDTPLSDAQRAMLTRSRESSVALLTIINDILDFSKITARKLDLESRPLSLRSLVEDICMTLMPEAARKGIDLGFEVDAQIPEIVLGDAVRLRQVLTNLVGNAVKFTKQGGVKVVVDRSAGEALLLSVQDSGIGIDPEAAKTIFLPFKQADIATTRRFGGTGLGLTIVKQLVELMGGRVHCESEPGVGSRFVVALPLQPWIPGAGAVQGQPAADRPAADALARSSTTAPMGEGRRLLLAEDHPINREVVVMQLAKLGFACDCAEDGEEAWERLLAPGAAYAMLLTDCHMPRLNGYDLTTRLREREAALGLPRLPIIALTANALQGEHERCLALGMDSYLSKPLQLHEFREALAGILARGRPEGPALPHGAVSQATSTAPYYPALTQLCGGQLDKVAELLRIFISTTEGDLKAMDLAADADDSQQLKQLAHRLSSACHQLDETRATAALKAIERQVRAGAAGLAADVRALHAATRLELAEVLARASAFVRTHAPAAAIE
ncbi:PAS domain-containing hybrid sensor histidine kinase/response regulator [Variovorax ginsengisoli]|uniref:histidine kinase n=1 Tax=Variovorax ginsengisoli TaxID=363844 RepID=A0ABT8S9F7_9BURK|nr:PAS domain-containing hybrid sensor histidine kinase/response regulator [Variovorax ginsengisoli]MDN8616248.1 ATP-binding protein [Variovorax ginsengisoli]MDO1535418.1 ATP-binding protein [Variovorax ginsengisoli]